MSHFLLHFFKEKSRTLDKEEVVYFFSENDAFEIDFTDKLATFKYTHPKLGYEANFYMTPKSVFPNIQRISPQYLEVNFHLEFPIFSPTYFVKDVLQIVKKICEKFDLFVLSEMFQDVQNFNLERILKVFNMVKKAYNEKYPEKAEDYFFVREEKLSSILRYIDEQDSLIHYYEDLNTVVPKYLFVKDEDNKPYFACEWKEGELSVLPPYIDYIFFKDQKNMVKIVDYDEYLKRNQKILLDVPGFLQGTKVITKKFYKKLVKSVKKGKFTPVTKKFAKYHLHELMD